MKIGLAKLNNVRVLAYLETADGMVDVCLAWTHGKACAMAAMTLRRMADKFDALAKERDPLHIHTQSRVNRGKLGGGK